jgi:hypothetical protein
VGCFGVHARQRFVVVRVRRYANMGKVDTVLGQQGFVDRSVSPVTGQCVSFACHKGQSSASYFVLTVRGNRQAHTVQPRGG